MRHAHWGIGFLALVACSSESATPGSIGGTSTPTPGPGQPFDGGESPRAAGQPPLQTGAVNAEQAPPAVSGGTLLILKDQNTALVADPERDQVVLVDLAKLAVTRTITLPRGSEPGRAAEDADGRVHLVLRGSGKLASIDPTSGNVIGTRAVCAYPRGVAVAELDEQVYVACAEGNLVTLSTDATKAEPIRNLKLDRDLRDVVVTSDGVWLSRFRSAEILRLDSEGKVLFRTSLPNAKGIMGESVSSVAWRMVPNAAGGVIVVHQRAFAGEVAPSDGGYGSTGVAGGMVSSAVSAVSENGSTSGTAVALSAPLPVDVAQSPVSGRLLLAAAAMEHPTVGSNFGRTLLLNPSQLQFSAAPSGENTAELDGAPLPRGQLVAVAFAGDTPVLQYRSPMSLVVGDKGVTLPGDAIVDTGNQLFHLETSSGLACASCHPEGQEDGRVWKFAGFGPRRTQSLRGGLRGTEPFHWDGLEKDFNALTSDVMQGRMGGPPLTEEQGGSLLDYLDALPAMPAPAAALSPSAERGKELFNDPNVGCATCHNGARLSNDRTVDIGSVDGTLQVPGLIGLWSRAPYLHDGCAKTVADRFSHACDTGSHGNIAGLQPADVTALSDYLETL